MKMEVFVGRFVENDPDKSGFGVWPKPNYINFLEGVLLCPKLISDGFCIVVFLKNS